MTRRWAALVPVVLIALVLGSCTGNSGDPNAPAPAAAPSVTAAPTGQIAAVCDRMPPGPATAPPGAVVVDPAVEGDLVDKTKQSPPGTTFWLAPGRHTLGSHQFDQVSPKDGNVYLGGPGAIVDGRGLNQYGFSTTARNVTIRFLTVTNFVPPQDQGVVNHDSGDGWIIEHNTIEKNRGAGLMAGAHQQVRGNCLRDNGQYGLNAFQPSNGITGLVVEGNEITGNNTEDWETRSPGCGCTGGVKFWSVNGADVRGNWIHDNRGAGLWADTNNNDFVIEGNLIESNDSEALLYETSYNLVFRDNTVRRNMLVAGKRTAQSGDNFPSAAIYLSEAGGEPRVPARTDKIDIYENAFVDNWSGITAWENADRFCNSPANTSTDSCTLLVPRTEECAQPGIATPPLYDDCRWKTQRVDIHDNTFHFDPAAIGCFPGFAGRMAVLSNWGTYPEWSPYKGDVVQQAITRDQQVAWRDNRYTGPWTFVLGDVGRSATVAQWQGAPFGQDRNSAFTAAEGSC